MNVASAHGGPDCRHTSDGAHRGILSAIGISRQGAAIELARADRAIVQGQVRRAVPVTRPQPPPQAVITLQVSPLAFWTKAQIVYALLAPEAH